MEWYLVYCRSRQEERAKLHLCNQGFETYLPRVFAERVCRGKRQHSEIALFPNYLFVKVDTKTGDFYKVRSTRGVSDFVRVGGKPAQVSSDLIKTLALNEERLEKARALDCGPRPGQKIRLLSGPFKGLNAVYKMPDGAERIKVVIDILSNRTLTSVSLKDIEPS